MERCRSCGKESEDDSKFCVHCGRPFSEVKRCPKCGHDNPAFSRYCGECSTELPVVESSPYDSMPEKVRNLPTQKKYCPTCGGQMSIYDSVCPACDVSESRLGKGEFLRTSQSSAPTIGGVLAILAGVLAIGQGLLYMAGSSIVDIPGSGTLCFCGAVDFVFGAASVLGGLSALKRDGFTLAIIGAVMGMLGLGFLIGGLFGFIAVILIAMSRNEIS
ncbi:MAG: zinc ribbon domain-containing protein [Methanobacteriota archaeon]|nr:MAG: zinc ribbon domain-containing protein [Euryarchaeota archaeon]